MSLGILCGLILAAMPWAITGLSNKLGRARKENVKLSELFRCGAVRCGATLRCVLLLLSCPGGCRAALMPPLSPATHPPTPHADACSNSHNINVLSLSRVFLFGSRDLWFEVTLPFFLRSTASGIGWSRPLVGAFLAIWIIVYGQVQSWTPQLVLGPLKQAPPGKRVAALWAGILTGVPLILGIVMLAGSEWNG